MAYADHEDVQSRYETDLDERLEAIVNVRLGDAERIIRSRIRDLDDKVTSGELDVELVKQIEAEMVLRLVRNPDGYSQESDGNYSYAIYQQVASGKLSVLDSEWDLLGLKSGMFTLTPDLGWNGILAEFDPVARFLRGD